MAVHTQDIWDHLPVAGFPVEEEDMRRGGMGDSIPVGPGVGGTRAPGGLPEGGIQAPDDDPQAVGVEVVAGRLQEAPPLAPPCLALALGEADRLLQPQLLQLVDFL